MVRILGITFRGATHRSLTDTWNRAAGHIKLLATQAYSRDLCLAQHISFVHTYLLAKIWSVAHFFPAYAYDMAYIPPLKEGKTPLAVRKKMYVSLDMLYRFRNRQDIQAGRESTVYWSLA
jgi:hypothetical protein